MYKYKNKKISFTGKSSSSSLPLLPVSTHFYRLPGGYNNDDDECIIYHDARRMLAAQRACAIALRALGLFLADRVPTVGWFKTFWGKNGLYSAIKRAL